MTSRITEIFAGMAQRQMMADQATTCRDFTQAEDFFHLAREKARRVEQLRQRFAGRRIGKLFVGNNLAPAGLRLPGIQTLPLAPDHFERATRGALQDMVSAMAGAIVLVNNNDLAGGESRAGYVRLFGASPDTIFLGWDYDNHHWIESSLPMAAHTDLYFPAHNENMYPLSKINALTAGPVPCACVQWTPQFLADNLGAMLSRARSDEPLGMHFFYPVFAFRNQTVVTLSQKYKHIGFAERSFQTRSPAERLGEWMHHKIHWIIPVLNDVPIRIFDALVTGGIPILPESLRFIAPVSELPRDSVVFYGPDDILNPQTVVARALALFDEGGQEGIARRHRHAMTNHLGAQRLARMVAMAQERLEFAPFID